jgi:hypothetical protein
MRCEVCDYCRSSPSIYEGSLIGKKNKNQNVNYSSDVGMWLCSDCDFKMHINRYTIPNPIHEKPRPEGEIETIEEYYDQLWEEYDYKEEIEDNSEEPAMS